MKRLYQRMLCAKFGASFGRSWPSGSLNFVNVFSLFRNYISFEKNVALHLNKLEPRLPTDALCQVWLKSAQWFWRRRWKCEKFTNIRTDRQTDDRQQGIRKLTWAFSWGEQNKSISQINLFMLNGKWLKQWFILLQLVSILL